MALSWQNLGTKFVTAARSVVAGTGLSGGGALDADRTLSVVYGTGSGTAAQGNDSRLSNARTPTAHASTHATGGGDAITPANIGAATTSHAHAGADVSSGTVDIARLPVASSGTSNTTQVPRADDSRLSNARTPTAHVHAGADVSSGTVDIARLPVATSGTSNTTQVPRADDSRLSNARTPTAHVHAAADVSSGTLDIARIPTGSTSTTVATGDRVAALEAFAPSDLGFCRRVARTTTQSLGPTNRALSFTTSTNTTAHVQVVSATVLRILTAGVWQLHAGVYTGNPSGLDTSLWIGTSDFSTRYVQISHNRIIVTCGVTVYLAANTDIIAGTYVNPTVDTVASLDLNFLSAALIRKG